MRSSAARQSTASCGCPTASSAVLCVKYAGLWSSSLECRNFILKANFGSDSSRVSFKR